MKFKNEEVTFLGWLDNVWYHYKAGIVIGLAALIIVAVAMTQLITRDEHDVFIYCVGEFGLSAEAGDKFMEEMQNEFAVDSNGDGKKVVDLKFDKFIMTEDANGKRHVYNPSEQLSITERFNLELATGECIIYIMEPAFFNANLEYLASFEEELGYIPENSVEGKGVRIYDIPFYWAEYYDENSLTPEKDRKTSTLAYFPKDYIICLADREERFDEEYYEGNVEFLKNLLEFQHTSDK